MFDLAEEALDEISFFVKVRAEADWVFAVGFWRDIRPGVTVLCPLPDMIGIVSLVGQQHGSGLQVRQQVSDSLHVVNLTRRDTQPDWQAASIDRRMDLGGQSSPAAAHTAISTPLFTAFACW